MSHTGRLVTAAALILFLAFVSLAAVPSTEIKIMATGLAAGILLDATVIRGLLVPATVSLMGHWNWWLPNWLDRIVPRTETTPRLPAQPHVNRAD
jgi:RND superfamily putative drug exporter